METRVCPWWLGYFLANPLRKLVHDPRKILGPYIREGMVVLEIGPGMGYFTLPMAGMVGDKGRIIAVDIQEQMLRSLRRRIDKAGLTGRVETRLCTGESLGIDDLSGKVDFAFAFAVLHEMPDIPASLRSVCLTLRPGGTLFIGEPKAHVSEKAFQETISAAKLCDLDTGAMPEIWHTRSVVMVRSHS